MLRILLALPLGLTVAAVAAAQPAKDAVQNVEAVFEPATAKPGQTVTLKVTVRLADGFYTYPTVQPAPEARFSANALTFPASGPLVFVGKTAEPPKPKAKVLDSIELLTYPGGGTWARPAVVAPDARPGATTVKVKLKLLVCQDDRCFPPKTYELEATLEVLDGPAVPVESKYRDEVEKAGKK